MYVLTYVLADVWFNLINNLLTIEKWLRFKKFSYHTHMHVKFIERDAKRKTPFPKFPGFAGTISPEYQNCVNCHIWSCIKCFVKELKNNSIAQKS